MLARWVKNKTRETSTYHEQMKYGALLQDMCCFPRAYPVRENGRGKQYMSYIIFLVHFLCHLFKHVNAYDVHSYRVSK